MTNGYTGTITGSVQGDMITVTYVYTVEGSQNREQELYRISTDGLRKLRYPLIDQGDILVPDTTQEYQEMIYTAAPCDDGLE